MASGDITGKWQVASGKWQVAICPCKQTWKHQQRNAKQWEGDARVGLERGSRLSLRVGGRGMYMCGIGVPLIVLVRNKEMHRSVGFASRAECKPSANSGHKRWLRTSSGDGYRYKCLRGVAETWPRTKATLRVNSHHPACLEGS